MQDYCVTLQEKAHRAMDELWKIRHRSSDLMGTVLNIHSGDWVRRDSGVGAGIDSYYEYCLKAYILLGDERYLGRFNKVCHVTLTATFNLSHLCIACLQRSICMWYSWSNITFSSVLTVSCLVKLRS
jgi:hypothetical protein